MSYFAGGIYHELSLHTRTPRNYLFLQNGFKLVMNLFFRSSSNETSAFIAAAQIGAPEMIRLFITEVGVPPNVEDHNGWTAMHAAAERVMFNSNVVILLYMILHTFLPFIDG